jgi:hypothetical protein
MVGIVGWHSPFIASSSVLSTPKKLETGKGHSLVVGLV